MEKTHLFIKNNDKMVLLEMAFLLMHNIWIGVIDE
jgi:hypothetical protein